MVLLPSLFIISGGVMLDGDIEATSAVNAAFLGAGALLSSVLRLGRARAPTRGRAAMMRDRSRISPLRLRGRTNLALLAMGQGQGFANEVAGVTHEVLGTLVSFG